MGQRTARNKLRVFRELGERWKNATHKLLAAYEEMLEAGVDDEYAIELRATIAYLREVLGVNEGFL